jgi:hypothetical protein
MTSKILVAGLAAGIVLFVWESLAHMALPLGEAGLSGLPNEAPILTAIKDNVKDDGFYYFPNPMMHGTAEQQKKRQEAMLAGPTGIMVVRPKGDSGITGTRLGLQAVFDILSMMIAGMVLSRAVALKGLGARVGLVASLSLLPVLRTELPQWNWYGFPPAYTAAQLTLHLVGFVLGGFVLAKMIKSV